MKEIKIRYMDTDNDNKLVAYSLSEIEEHGVSSGRFKYAGLFTGLKDKTGKKIYEGDILKTSDYDSRNYYSEEEDKVVPALISEMVGHYEVIFGHYSAWDEQGKEFHYGWSCRRMTDIKSLVQTLCDSIEQPYPGCSCHKHTCVGVIGNIYENPKLIKLLELRKANCNMAKDARGDKIEIGDTVSWHRQGKKSELCRILEIKDDLCLVERGHIGEVNGGAGFVNLDKPDRWVSLEAIVLNDIAAMMGAIGMVVEFKDKLEEAAT